eukprot:m.39515 g.39515  ORF g.39515 m.39515 type:complete len:333 (+) comp11615_c0_seq1:1640-2638(+)
MAIFVIPAIGREITGLAQHNLATFDFDKLIDGEILAGNRLLLGRKTGACARMQRREILRFAHQLERQLTHQHATCLKVDLLVFCSHDNSPERRGFQLTNGLKGRVVVNQIHNSVIDSLAVDANLIHGWPLHVVLAQIIPLHLIYPCLEDVLIVLIDGLADEASDTTLVDIDRGGVSIIEDFWVSEVMVRWAVKRFLCLQRSKQHLGHGPAVVKVITQLLAGDSGKVGLGKRADDAVSINAWALAVDGSFSCPPVSLAGTSKVLRLSTHVDAPGINNSLMSGGIWLCSCCGLKSRASSQGSRQSNRKRNNRVALQLSSRCKCHSAECTSHFGC